MVVFDVVAMVTVSMDYDFYLCHVIIGNCRQGEWVVTMVTALELPLPCLLFDMTVCLFSTDIITDMYTES